MKKIIGLGISIISLFLGINSIHAYYTINDMEYEQKKYGSINQREVYSITNDSKYGDYVVLDIDSIRTYYTLTEDNHFINFITGAIVSLYDENIYEKRKIVTKTSYFKDVKEKFLVSTTYKDVPIMGKYTYYGTAFEIPFYNVWYYLLKGSDVYTKVEYEYRYVWSWFKLVRKKVAVTNYYARNKYEKTVITGYKTVVDVPAHYEEETVTKQFPPETVTYNKYISFGKTNFGGFIEGLRVGAQATFDFFGEVSQAIMTGDATKISFIKNGREYLAKVLDEANNTGAFYKIIITDLKSNVVTTFNVAKEHFTKNPEAVFELMGTLTFAYASGKLVDVGLSKIDINITPRLSGLYGKNPSMMGKLIAKYGDDAVKYADDLGDDALNVLAKADDDVVKLLVDNLDDYKNATDLANTLDEFKDVTGSVGNSTFKPSYDVPKDPTTGFTKSYPTLGTKIHKEYKVGQADGLKKFKEFNGLPSKKRPDFIDFENKIIYELKPNNPKAIALGRKQLEMYKTEVESIYGGGWTTHLDTY